MKGLLASFVFLLLCLTTPSQANILMEACSNSANYTKGSQFETNLKHLLLSLVSKGLGSGFYKSISGSNFKKVYGLVQCRGDVSVGGCKACLNASVVVILERCPSAKAGVLRYDDCLVRYSNEDFFFKVDTSGATLLYNTADVSNVEVFNQQLETLMNNLSVNAAAKPSKFMTGSINYTDGFAKEIYGLVQCTRDLTSSSCSSCLETLISLIPQYFNGKIGAQIQAPSCILIYELGRKFYSGSSQPPSPVLLSRH